MAGKDEQVNLHLTAKDDATKIVAALDKRLDGLTDDEKIVVLKAAATQAQREVDSLTRRLAEAHRYDDDQIALFVEQRGNAQQRLDAIQSELREIDGRRVEAEVVADTSKAESSIGKLKSEIQDLDGPVGDVLGKLDKLATPAGGFTALAAGLVLAGEHAADLAIEADNIAKLTGDSVGQASRLNAVWKQSGADSKDLQDVLLQMAGVLETNAELAGDLGVNLDDGRTIGERFVQLIELLPKKFDDTAKRSVAMSQLFGEEGVRQVNAVLAQVGDLDKAMEDLPDGAVFDEAEVEKSREFKANVAELKTEASAFAAEIGESVLPLLTQALGLANLIADALPGSPSEFFTNGGPQLPGFEDFEDPFLKQQKQAEDLERAQAILARGTQDVADKQAQLAVEADHAAEATERAAEATGNAADETMTYEERLAGLTDKELAAAAGARARADAAEASALADEEAALAAEEAADSLLRATEAYEDYRQGINDAFQSAAQSFGVFDDAALKSSESFRAALNEQSSSVAAWKEDLAKIASETSTEFANALLELGPSGAQMVDELANNTDSLQSTFDTWKMNAAVMSSDMAAEMGAAPAAMSKEMRAKLSGEAKLLDGIMRSQGRMIGKSFAGGMAEGVEENGHLVTSAMRNVATSAASAVTGGRVGSPRNNG